MKNTFTLAHVGVNTENAEEALALAELLAGMFNLAPRHGQKSEFAGPYFECMKAPFHGKNGHIAMQTPDLESAVAELKEKGFSFREGDRGARRRREAQKHLSRRGIRRLRHPYPPGMTTTSLSKLRKRHPQGWRFRYALRCGRKTLSLFFVDRFLAGIYTELNKRRVPFVTKQ